MRRRSYAQPCGCTDYAFNDYYSHTTSIIPVPRLDQHFATYYAWLGDPTESLGWVVRAYELSPSGVEPRVLESALFDRVREDPEFSREVARLREAIWERVRRESRAIYE